MQPKLEAVYS